MSLRLERSSAGDPALVVAVVALALGGGFASCFLSGYDKVEDGGGGAGGATASSVGFASAQASTSSGARGEDLPQCKTTQFPEGPTGAMIGGAVDQWFALRSIELGDPDKPSSVPGFDLDRVDSCNEACEGDPECAAPDFLAGLDPEEAQERCDWPNAVDNSTVYLFESAALSLGATDAKLSAEADRGEWSILLRISEWNGSANDAEVTVGIYSTTGWQAPPDGGTTSASTGSGGAPPAPAPLWDGTDDWAIDARSLESPLDLETPAFQTDKAYIAGGMLVAELGGLFFLGSTRLPIRIASGRLLAPIELVQGQPPAMRDAVFAGRWPADDLIDAIGTLLVGDGPFCEATALFNPVVERACRLVDVTETGGLGTCSALSFGIRFDAEAVEHGTIVQPTGVPQICPPITCAQLLAQD